jgi:hypothetical protein
MRFKPDPRLEYRSRNGQMPETDPNFQAEAALVQRAREFAVQRYPGHPWEFECDIEQGIMKVSLPILSGATNKWVIPLRRHASTEYDFRKAVLGLCGEILERYKIPRQRFSEADFHTALHAIPANKRGFHGHVPESHLTKKKKPVPARPFYLPDGTVLPIAEAPLG